MSNIEVRIKTENDREENYFLTLSEASKISGYTPEHLNLLCRKGVLRGKKFGRNWHTTREWINEFLFLPKTKKEKKYQRRKKKIQEENYQAEIVSRENKTDLPDNAKNSSEKDGFVFENFQNSEKAETIKNKIDESKKKEKGRTWQRLVLEFSSAVFVSLLIFFVVSYFQYSQNEKRLAEKNIPENILEDYFVFSGDSVAVAGEEKVKGEETQNQAASISTSENFKLKEISFGGVLLASANGENLQLEVSDVTSEVFLTRDGKQAQMLISWKTNKPAVSEIEYSKSDVKNPKQIQEKDYGFSHSVVLAKLDLAATYVYQISATDKWGNKITSERFGIYTGSKMVSVFDLIFKAVNETFSWAIKK